MYEITSDLSTTQVVSVEWKLENFLDVLSSTCFGEVLLSQPFWLSDAKWILSLYPVGNIDFDSVGWLSLFLINEQVEENETHNVAFTLGIRKHDGSVFRSFDDRRVFEFKDEYGTAEFIKISELLKLKDILLPDGSLTVFCSAYLVDGAGDMTTHPYTQMSVDTLAQNFEDLFFSGRECDVTINVQDQAFQAHKTVLIARSKVFSSMFEHDALVNNSGTVNVVDCDPDSFKDFLHFVYSGRLDIVSAGNACSLYKTADKFNFVELKQECCRCLAHNLSMDCMWDVVLLATTHDEIHLLEVAKGYFIQNSEEILTTTRWQSFITEHPLLAVELVLKMMKKTKK